MSYSERHTGTVSYSGSKTVRYPASEHGGTMTVHYSGTIPVGITINVETDPFDRSVADTNTSLGVVAGAVAATEAAQVAEITRAGNRISQTAINGFYRVIASEMTAQISEFSSSMKSCVGLLAEEGKQVERVHQQMDADYHSIKARYVRIFNELDRELDQRVRELDRPAFQISQQAMRGTICTPYVESAAKVSTNEEEISSTALKLSCARSKQRVSASLDSLGATCDYIFDYEAKVSGVMCDEPSEGEVLVPVVYTLQKDLDAQGERIVVHGGNYELEEAVRRAVIYYVGSTPDEQWSVPVASDRQAIDDDFLRLVESYDSAQGGDAQDVRERVRQKMMELYRSNQTVCCYVNNG